MVHRDIEKERQDERETENVADLHFHPGNKTGHHLMFSVRHSRHRPFYSHTTLIVSFVRLNAHFNI